MQMGLSAYFFSCFRQRSIFNELARAAIGPSDNVTEGYMLSNINRAKARAGASIMHFPPTTTNSSPNQAAPGNWGHFLGQSGMFGFLGLSPRVIAELKEKYHVYMANTSRVSIARLKQGNVEFVARSIAKVLKGKQ